MEKVNVFANPTNPIAEAYRALCTNVLSGQGKKKLIEITGVADESSVRILAVNLAVAMAQAGKRVLLMDCNLRKPKQHEIFGLQNIGLTDCLCSVQNFGNYIQRTSQYNLEVMTAGTAASNPVEILLSNSMQELLNLVRNTYDIVLLDVPAAGSVVDAVALGTKTDGLVLVLTNRKDKVEQVQKVKEALIQAGVTILGCVLNKADIL